MKNVLEIRAKIKSLKDNGNEILNLAEQEKRDMNPEEKARFNSITSEIDQNEAKLDAYIQEHRLQDEVNNMDRRIAYSDPGDFPGAGNGMEMAVKFSEDRSYRGMFYQGDKIRELDRGGFKNLNEFLSAVASGRRDDRLESRTMLEGTPSLGGFAVPEQYAGEWLDNALETEIIRPRARVYPMLTESLKIPAWDDLDHTNGQVYGGFTISWLNENGTATRQTPKLRKILLNAKKAGIYVNASREMVQDGINFDSQLRGALSKGLSYGLDNAFINGTGAGQPIGILSANSLISVAKETGQDADTIVYENITKMEARLHPNCDAAAVWLANPTTKPQLKQISQAVGTGGTVLKLLTRIGNQYYLDDRPILFSEKCNALGTKGDLILVDLTKYAIGLRQDLQIDMSNVVGWLNDTIDFRVIVRVDGMPIWDQSFTPKNGNPLSWAVALNDR